MAASCKPITSAEVRYFDLSESDPARARIDQGVTAIRQ
jgi:hypothetical protein